MEPSSPPPPPHEDKRGGWVGSSKLKGAFWDYANGLKRSTVLFTLWTPFSSKRRGLTHVAYGLFSFPGLAFLEILACQACLNLQCVRKITVNVRSHIVLVSVGCILCVENIGSFLPTFRENLSVPSLSVKNVFLTVEDGTDSLSRTLVTQKSPVLINLAGETWNYAFMDEFVMRLRQISQYCLYTCRVKPHMRYCWHTLIWKSWWHHFPPDAVGAWLLEVPALSVCRRSCLRGTAIPPTFFPDTCVNSPCNLNRYSSSLSLRMRKCQRVCKVK